MPYLLNLGCSTLALAGIALIGHVIGLRPAQNALAVVLAGSMTWFIWLSLSGLTDPIYLCCIVYGYLGACWWRWRGAPWALWLAAVMFAAAGMARFDGWGHSVVFSLGVLWYWWRHARPRPHWWLIAVLIPWIFPIFWLSRQWLLFGHPFFFSQIVQSYYLAIMGPQPLLRRLTWQVSDLWAIAGPIALIGPFGLYWCWRKPGVAWMTLMWLAALGLLIQSTLSHTISVSHPIRQMVLHAVLLCPGAALIVSKIAERLRWWPIGLVLIGLLWGRLSALPSYPNYLTSDVQAISSHVGALRTMGIWQPQQKMMVEVLFWDYILLTVLSNAPDDVVYDRAPIPIVTSTGEHTMDEIGNPSLLALPPEQLKQQLAARGVVVVVAYSPRAIAHLRPIARQSEQVGRFYAFVLDR
ncbi:MAG: hypothetical protein Fur005_02650 [Roseiflexaceae bacterium]